MCVANAVRLIGDLHARREFELGAERRTEPIGAAHEHRRTGADVAVSRERIAGGAQQLLEPRLHDAILVVDEILETYAGMRDVADHQHRQAAGSEVGDAIRDSERHRRSVGHDEAAVLVRAHLERVRADRCALQQIAIHIIEGVSARVKRGGHRWIEVRIVGISDAAGVHSHIGHRRVRRTSWARLR